MIEPILMRLGYNGRSIWWIPGQPKPDLAEIDARHKRFNAMLDSKHDRASLKLTRTTEGWAENGTLLLFK